MHGMDFHKTPRVKTSHQIEVGVIHYDGIPVAPVCLFSGQVEAVTKLLKGKMPPP